MILINAHCRYALVELTNDTLAMSAAAKLEELYVRILIHVYVNILNCKSTKSVGYCFSLQYSYCVRYESEIWQHSKGLILSLQYLWSLHGQIYWSLHRDLSSDILKT